MFEIQKGAYISDTEGGTPIIKLENGNNYYFGGIGKPPTSGFFRYTGGSWCYPATEQEYNEYKAKQANEAPVKSQEQTTTINQEVFHYDLRRDLHAALAKMKDQNAIVLKAIANLPEDQQKVIVPDIENVSDAITLAMRTLNSFNHK